MSSGCPGPTTPGSPPRTGGAAAGRRGEEPLRPRARGVHRAGLGVEEGVGGQIIGQLKGSAPPATGSGSGSPWTRGSPGRCARFRPSLRGGADLPGQPADQLVPPLPYRPFRHRGGTRGTEGASLVSPLPGGRLGPATWWSPPPAPRRCSGTPPWR